MMRFLINGFHKHDDKTVMVQIEPVPFTEQVDPFADVLKQAGVNDPNASKILGAIVGPIMKGMTGAMMGRVINLPMFVDEFNALKLKLGDEIELSMSVIEKPKKPEREEKNAA